VTRPGAGESIGDLGQRYRLPSFCLGQLAAFAELLADVRIAPTAIHHPQQILQDHIADSLVALELPEVASASSIVDIGSGAGVPGLPLAITLPRASVVLLESNGRRCEFIAAAIRTCGVGNASAIAGRAELWSDGLGRFDIVTARALAALEVVVEYAAPLLGIGGSLVAWRGRRDELVEAHAARAASILGLAAAPPYRALPFPGAKHRYLHVFTKVTDTPEGFPRRAGMARKRPLGSSRTPSV
jgi:16S rRNA (guanine527-N7)-methyltransferase